MKIELKNCKVNLTFSEETIMFKADVHINGKKAAYAQNEGYGGATSIHHYSREYADLVKQADDYMKAQPPKKYQFGDTEMEFNQSLESYVDDLVSEIVDKNERKRMDAKIKKDSKKGLVISKDNLRSYEVISWKGFDIESILKAANGYAVLRMAVNDYRSQGYTIYNDNLPSNILN